VNTEVGVIHECALMLTVPLTIAPCVRVLLYCTSQVSVNTEVGVIHDYALILQKRRLHLYGTAVLHLAG
jgi:hypothetical protein